MYNSHKKFKLPLFALNILFYLKKFFKMICGDFYIILTRFLNINVSMIVHMSFKV